MIEMLVALVLAVLILAVFRAPAFVIKLGEFGGLAFVLYITILVLKFLVGKLRP